MGWAVPPCRADWFWGMFIDKKLINTTAFQFHLKRASAYVRRLYDLGLPYTSITVPSLPKGLTFKEILTLVLIYNF